MRKRGDDRTLLLFASGQGSSERIAIDWPHGGRFPLNDGGDKVENWVWNDLKRSRSPLIISGYSSLDRFLEFASVSDREAQVRLLVGNEPFASRRQEFQLLEDELPALAEKYWLGRGVSLIRSAALIRTIERLKEGSVQARYLRGGNMLHAKIYCSDQAATLGSSNFTEPGLVNQHEANARFERDGVDADRYNELTKIAEGFWSLGTDYSHQLMSLLEKLLKPVHWDEALARACAEVLEGDWASIYLHGDYLGDADTLWPSQKQGIAQALLVLDQQGSVLIADATGAGKTRMGTHLVGAVHDNIVRSGRLWHGKAVMIAPPTVVEEWEREVLRTHVQLDVRSHGELSHRGSRRHALRVEELKRAQILCVDEGHNFLNLKAQRTQLILGNMADHVVMLTATPINRGITDLLRIADVLGADNLEPSTIETFHKMLRAKDFTRSLTSPEVDQLRLELRKFTVRRTKSMLNVLIDREPAAYRSKDGRECRFPKHNPNVYKLEEPQSDRELAHRIKNLADTLYGVTHFVRPIEMPTLLHRQGVTEAQYLHGRLSSAKKLARYAIMKALRSSRAALLEHIHGTTNTLKEFSLTQSFRKDETGNQYQKVQDIAGRIPENKLSVDLPDWLSTESAHAEVCRHDANIYLEISKLAREISAHRETRKVELLTTLLEESESVLAFDSRPITLALLQGMLLGKGVSAMLATGDAKSDRDRLLSALSLGSAASKVLGLCSDSLSEGVNMQRASVLVHLDMPSVVRVAEQRAGRIDRLDSPHSTVHVWWPDDADEFALSSDERLIERFETVERLLGSNVPLPEHLQRQADVSPMKVTARQMVEEYENTAGTAWDGIDDAFSPIRGLLDGPDSLISKDVYERYRIVTEKVLSRVSLVSATQPWAFFCLSAGAFNAPRWLFMSSANEDIQSEFTAIVAMLRDRLGPDVHNLPLDDRSAKTMSMFLDRLPMAERCLLSRKKQRAIHQLLDVCGHLTSYVSSKQQAEDLDFLEKLQDLLSHPSKDRLPDWNEIAARWLDIIRPIWFERLREKRSRPLLLEDIRSDLLDRPDWVLEAVRRHFGVIPAPHHPDERIRACIIGVQ